MKVAIPTEGNSWNDRVAADFGKAPCYFVIDERRAQVQVISHPAPHEEDAGRHIVPLLTQAGVQLVIAQGCSTADSQRLKDAGIRAMMGVQGTVDLVYRRFYHGLLGTPCEEMIT